MKIRQNNTEDGLVSVEHLTGGTVFQNPVNGNIFIRVFGMDYREQLNNFGAVKVDNGTFVRFGRNTKVRPLFDAELLVNL